MVWVIVLRIKPQRRGAEDAKIAEKTEKHIHAELEFGMHVAAYTVH
jgi:hypothetical protein